MAVGVRGHLIHMAYHMGLASHLPDPPGSDPRAAHRFALAVFRAIHCLAVLGLSHVYDETALLQFLVPPPHGMVAAGALCHDEVRLMAGTQPCQPDITGWHVLHP
mmetsp:Transcript_30405/g.78852  ORF Transcript_30405/g.78852 Transcript_30405/m.78852 type:complete len:105 (-) Transcript_30405:602-916(-)